jgi:hypothetical protein
MSFFNLCRRCGRQQLFDIAKNKLLNYKYIAKFSLIVFFIQLLGFGPFWFQDCLFCFLFKINFVLIFVSINFWWQNYVDQIWCEYIFWHLSKLSHKYELSQNLTAAIGWFKIVNKLDSNFVLSLSIFTNHDCAERSLPNAVYHSILVLYDIPLFRKINLLQIHFNIYKIKSRSAFHML